MIIDPLSTGATDTCVQGLVGRCCGFGKAAHGVKFLTSKDHLQNYVNEINNLPPTGRIAARTLVAPIGHSTMQSSAYVQAPPPLPVLPGQEVDEDILEYTNDLLVQELTEQQNIENQYEQLMAEMLL